MLSLQGMYFVTIFSQGLELSATYIRKEEHLALTGTLNFLMCTLTKKLAAKISCCDFAP